MEVPHEAPGAGLPPFQVICPTCGRHSDAEETEFFLVVAVPGPRSEWLLAGITCGACGTRVDRALWPVETEPLETAVRDLEALDPEMIALRARYNRAVADYRWQWERLARARGAGPFWHAGINLSELAVVPSLAPKMVVDMRILAAAQACREVALQCPGQDPVGLLLVGSYRCALSLDAPPDARHRGVLHLSVSHALGLGRLQRIEEAFLAGLYFTAIERPFLSEESGHLVPCTHIRYPLLAAA
jgi:hypothetical protein